MAKKIPDEIKSRFPKGHRVQLHPGTDAWMMGDRFGEIRGYVNSANDGALIRVRLDKSRKIREFHPRNLAEVFAGDPKKNPSKSGPKVGDTFKHDRFGVLKIVKVHPFGTYDVKAKGGQHYRVTGLPMKNPRRVKTSGEDRDAAQELELFIMNDADLYRQQLTPIRLNLLRKYAAGKYDGVKAPKLWEYLAESGAQKYVKEHGGGHWFNVFTPETRRYAARQMAGSFEQAMKAGEYDHLVTGGIHLRRLKALRLARGREQNPSKHAKKNPAPKPEFVIVASKNGRRFYFDASRMRFVNNGLPSLYATVISAERRARTLLDNFPILRRGGYKITIEGAGALPKHLKKNPKGRKGEIKFKDLSINDEFEFAPARVPTTGGFHKVKIGDGPNIKVSERTYIDRKGSRWKIGSVSAWVTRTPKP